MSNMTCPAGQVATKIIDETQTLDNGIISITKTTKSHEECRVPAAQGNITAADLKDAASALYKIIFAGVEASPK